MGVTLVTVFAALLAFQWGSTALRDSSVKLLPSVSSKAILVKRLLSNYEKVMGPLLMPQRNVGDTTQVNTQLRVLALTDVDTNKNMFEMDVWLHLSWNDYRLVWDPSMYDGVNKIDLPIEKLWRPDVRFYYGRSTETDGSGIGAIIKHDGEVTWIRPMHVKSYCRFPEVRLMSRTAVCGEIKVGSWTHDARELDLQLLLGEGVSLDDYRVNPWDWTLVNATSDLVTTTYECCEEHYRHISYTFVLER